MHKTIFGVIIAVLIVTAGAFYGWIKYAEQKAQSGREQRIRQFGGVGSGFRNGGQESRINGGVVAGEILSKDDKSITVKTRDGGSKIIFYSDTTEIGKFAAGSLGDLEIGKTVSVSGIANSDGSVTAEVIQMRPVR